VTPAAPAPSRVPLTGADCFLRAFDAEIARCNRASHVSQLVLRLGPGFDAERFAAQLRQAASAQPILRAPVRRRFGVGAPAFQLTAAARCPAPALEVHDAAAPPRTGDPPAAIFQQRLNERRSLRRGELLRFDLVRYGGDAGSDLAMSWLHLLFDGAGSEHFVAWLAACGAGQASLAELPDPDELTRQAPASLPARERGDAARRWQAWLEGFRAHEVRSLAGPRSRAPQALEWRVDSLSPLQTEAAVAAASKHAGFLTPMLFYLAAVIRAHHAVFRARNAVPGSYVIPLPVNVRPRGAESAIFRTHVSLLWFQVTPDCIDDLPALIGELKRQRLDAIKTGRVEAGSHAMDFARFAPARLYAHMARRAFAGELCSFFFAWTGHFLPGVDEFFGAPIRNGFHVAPVPPSPGSCAALSLFRDHLNITPVRQAGVFSDAEAALFRDQLRADLAGPA
jgi:hypothetical protein